MGFFFPRLLVEGTDAGVCCLVPCAQGHCLSGTRAAVLSPGPVRPVRGGWGAAPRRREWALGFHHHQLQGKGDTAQMSGRSGAAPCADRLFRLLPRRHRPPRERCQAGPAVTSAGRGAILTSGGCSPRHGAATAAPRWGTRPRPCPRSPPASWQGWAMCWGQLSSGTRDEDAPPGGAFKQRGCMWLG